jgi:hypothetical protein
MAQRDRTQIETQPLSVLAEVSRVPSCWMMPPDVPWPKRDEVACYEAGITKCVAVFLCFFVAAVED